MPSYSFSCAEGYHSLMSRLACLAKLAAKVIRYVNRPRVVLRSRGFCPTCSQIVTFVSRDAWLRDHYLCRNCKSKPRERALMRVLEMYFPNWQEKVIHESSPIPRGASVRLSKECKQYIPSQLYPDIHYGVSRDGVRCENLECLTFADESIDLHITQDVMEHVFRPDLVFKEIARTLKPGGAHLFTVPIVNKHQLSCIRAKMDGNGLIEYILPAKYHGNPVSKDGALVTMDWGFDICQKIFESSSLYTHVVHIDDLSRGIRAEYIEVLITIKPDTHA